MVIAKAVAVAAQFLTVAVKVDPPAHLAAYVGKAGKVLLAVSEAATAPNSTINYELEVV